MEVVALEHFNKLKPSTITMSQSHSNLSDGSDHNASTTAAHICILLQFLLKNQMTSPYLITVLNKTDGCANQYCFASDIYLLSCLDL